jgi:hypothetical protein
LPRSDETNANHATRSIAKNFELVAGMAPSRRIDSALPFGTGRRILSSHCHKMLTIHFQIVGVCDLAIAFGPHQGIFPMMLDEGLVRSAAAGLPAAQPGLRTA